MGQILSPDSNVSGKNAATELHILPFHWSWEPEWKQARCVKGEGDTGSGEMGSPEGKWFLRSRSVNNTHQTPRSLR